MKSFDDFLKTLTPADLDSMQDSIQGLETFGVAFTEQEMRLSQAISKASALFIREILEKYHNWLIEQIHDA